MPEGLLESELFGHTKGAFTGAQIARRGLFLEASRGTIFLDEIGEMPVGMQAKLLRVLEQQHIRPVGSDREVQVDVRVLAATNQDLQSAVAEGRFREDLFYRLKVIVVHVPPLRDHPEDIPLLAETFLQRYTTSHKLGERRFTRDALRQLENYQWPGNVRELSHVVERAVTLCDGEWVDAEDLGFDDTFSLPVANHFGSKAACSSGSPSQPMFDTFNLDDVTRRLVVAALEKTRGHKSKAASLLGIHPRTLTRMLRRYNLPAE